MALPHSGFVNLCRRIYGHVIQGGGRGKGRAVAIAHGHRTLSRPTPSRIVRQLLTFVKSSDSRLSVQADRSRYLLFQELEQRTESICGARMLSLSGFDHVLACLPSTKSLCLTCFSSQRKNARAWEKRLDMS